MNPGFATDADLLKRIRILQVGDQADVGALFCICWIRWDAKSGPTRTAIAYAQEVGGK